MERNVYIYTFSRVSRAHECYNLFASRCGAHVQGILEIIYLDPRWLDSRPRPLQRLRESPHGVAKTRKNLSHPLKRLYVFKGFPGIFSLSRR